jgi:hypothetical protein
MSNHYIVGLSQESDTIRFGYNNQKTYLYNQSRDRTIIKGVNKFITLVNSYAESYNIISPAQLTVGHQKDLYTSLLLSKCIRSCQSKDSLYEILTPHAQKYWRLSNAHFLVWGSVPAEYVRTNTYTVPDGYYGTAGSLAFYLFKYQANVIDLSPLDIVKRALELLWLELNIDPTLSAQQLHLNVLNKSGINNINYNLYETALNYIWKNPNIHGSITNIVYELRSWAVTVDDFKNLKQKFIFSQVKPMVLTALTQLQTFINNRTSLSFQLPEELNIFNADPNVFNEVSNSVLNYAKPAGMALIYQALAIHGLLQVCYKLNSLPKNILTSKYYDYIKYSNDSNLFLNLATHLATGYDAYAALAYLDTFLEARGLSYYLYQKAVELISYNPELSISFNNNNTRITSFL